ncbi:MAG: GDP-mannose 4,6-dehydratase [Nanoarchaeota archaeon]
MINGKKVALIFGISGQDGSYLAEILLEKGYLVRGVIRRASFPNTKRIDHLDKYDEIHGKTDASPFFLLYGDLGDATSIRKVIENVKPDEIYNLGAQSHVGISFDNPESTINYNSLGPLRILEAIKDMNLKCKYYQASSSEMFGISPPPQSESTPMLPQSPYGVSKLAAYHLTRMYRNAYGMFAANGILFNHESPRRGVNFVTRKITLGIAKIVLGKEKKLTLGNLDAKRDWGFSKEYMEAVWKILQQDKPDDFVIATRETHTIREFLQESFHLLGLNWENFVDISDRYKRPAEVPALLGDPTKAESTLNWHPKTHFKELVNMMLASDLRDAMIEHGLTKGSEHHPDEYYLDKARELAKNL